MTGGRDHRTETRSRGDYDEIMRGEIDRHDVFAFSFRVGQGKYRPRDTSRESIGLTRGVNTGDGPATGVAVVRLDQGSGDETTTVRTSPQFADKPIRRRVRMRSADNLERRREGRP